MFSLVVFQRITHYDRHFFLSFFLSSFPRFVYILNLNPAAEKTFLDCPTIQYSFNLFYSILFISIFIFIFYWSRKVNNFQTYYLSLRFLGFVSWVKRCQLFQIQVTIAMLFSDHFRESHITTDTSFFLSPFPRFVYILNLNPAAQKTFLDCPTIQYSFNLFYSILFISIFIFIFLLVKKSKQFSNLLFVSAFLGFRFMSEKMSTVSNSSHDCHVIQRPGSFRLRVKSSSIATTSG